MISENPGLEKNGKLETSCGYSDMNINRARELAAAFGEEENSKM